MNLCLNWTRYSLVNLTIDPLPLVRAKQVRLALTNIEARPVWNLCTYSLYLLAVNVLKV